MITTAGITAVTELFGGAGTLKDFIYIGYGSGTAVVGATDETLGTEDGRALATVTVKSVLKPDDTLSYTTDFLTTVAGRATEVGLFTAATEGTMLLRTLLVAPAVYTIGATLTVTAEVTIKNFEAGEGANW
jgi:hypothetical protein